MPSSKLRQVLEGELGILFSSVPEDAITVRYCLQGEQGEVKGLSAGCLFCMSPWFDTARQLVNSLNQGSNINSHSFHSLTVCRLDNVKHPNITAILCLCVYVFGGKYECLCVNDVVSEQSANTWERGQPALFILNTGRFERRMERFG